ncbi:MAG TPA: hypothetical protein VJL31_07985 [Gemmatimonadales bacterium]|nr:hypothetical protein [Gemmatimonadales bacterium]
MRRGARVIGLGGLAALLVLWGPALLRSGTEPARAGRRAFRVEASATAFRPAVLELQPGDSVAIELVATDVVHGLLIEGYGLSVTAEPGRPGRLAFVADRPGSFRLRCSVTCGPLHPFVVGRLDVGPIWLLWRGVTLALVVAFLGLWVVRR